MIYYKIYPSIDLKVIGIYNQVQKFEVTEGVTSLKTGESLSYQNIPHIGHTTFNPVFPDCKLHKLAKSTDFINTNFSEIDLVSLRVLEIIQSLNSDSIEYFKINLNKKGVLLPYYGIRFPFIRDKDMIDWDRTYFIRTKLATYLGDPIEIHQFKGEDEYIFGRKNAILNNEKIYPQKLILKSTDKDIFRLSFSNHGIIISEKLKDAFESNKITGRRYINIDDLIPEATQP
jgi:hypothetical protein